MFIQQSIYKVKVTLLFLEQKKTRKFPWMNFSSLTSFTSFKIFHGWLYRSGTDWSFIFYRAQTCQYVYVFEVEMIFLNSMFLDFSRFFTFMLHKLDILTSEFRIVPEIRNYCAIFRDVGILVWFLKLWCSKLFFLHFGCIGVDTGTHVVIQRLIWVRNVPSNIDIFSTCSMVDSWFEFVICL